MPRNFYHIWSSLALLDFLGMKRITCLCLTQTSVSDDDRARPRIFVAGAVLIHFLGQVELFYACDSLAN